MTTLSKPSDQNPENSLTYALGNTCIFSADTKEKEATMLNNTYSIILYWQVKETEVKICIKKVPPAESVVYMRKRI